MHAQRISKNAENDCWEWRGAKSTNGYGMLSLGGDTWRAHRLMWAFVNGPIPAGNVICHHCDNPSCVNPAHLFVGTYSENLEDCFRKGRRRGILGGKSAKDGKSITALPKRPKSKRPPRTTPSRAENVHDYVAKFSRGSRAPGELHSTAKITEDQAREIISSLLPGHVLAGKFNLAPGTISKIRNGHLWKHPVVDPPENQHLIDTSTPTR